MAATAATGKEAVVALYTHEKHEPRIGSSSGDAPGGLPKLARLWDEKTGTWTVMRTKPLGDISSEPRPPTQQLRVHITDDDGNVGVFVQVPLTKHDIYKYLEALVGSRVVFLYSVQHGKQVCTVHGTDAADVVASVDVVGPRPRSTTEMENHARLFGESVGLAREHAREAARAWARCSGASSYRSYDRKAYRDAVKMGVPPRRALRQANTGDRRGARIRVLQKLLVLRKQKNAN
jgi:hypothetical protein